MFSQRQSDGVDISCLIHVDGYVPVMRPVEGSITWRFIDYVTISKLRKLRNGCFLNIPYIITVYILIQKHVYMLTIRDVIELYITKQKWICYVAKRKVTIHYNVLPINEISMLCNSSCNFTCRCNDAIHVRVKWDRIKIMTSQIMDDGEKEEKAPPGDISEIIRHFF